MQISSVARIPHNVVIITTIGVEVCINVVKSTTVVNLMSVDSAINAAINSHLSR